MIPAFVLLLSLQLLGELMVAWLSLPLPGPVAGLLLLFGVLVARGGAWSGLERAAGALLSHLPLFFVPAGVGAALWLSLFVDEWAAIGFGLVGSTLAGLAAAGLVGRAVLPVESDAGDTPERTS